MKQGVFDKDFIYRYKCKIAQNYKKSVIGYNDFMGIYKTKHFAVLSFASFFDLEL
jgi:hypothetical protein